MVYGFMVLQQYFSYILVVSFIGGGNWRKMGTDCISPLML
jgi:hypothetical protein